MDNDEEFSDAPTIHFSLRVQNFGEDPDVVTRILGLQPTDSGPAGSYRILFNGRKAIKPRARATWSIVGSTDSTLPMCEHVKELAAITRSCTTFDQLPLGSRVSFFGTIIPGDINPYHTIPADCLPEMGRIGAELVFGTIRIVGGPSEEELADRSEQSA